MSVSIDPVVCLVRCRVYVLAARHSPSVYKFTNPLKTTCLFERLASRGRCKPGKTHFPVPSLYKSVRLRLEFLSPYNSLSNKGALLAYSR